MKTQAGIVTILLIIAGITACTTMRSEEKMGERGHAALTEQERLIACSDCHQQGTPEIYNEWYASTHGLANVKCYQCHNTFGNLKKTPDIGQSCNSCHADKVGNSDHTEGLATCWECHAPHSFTAQ